MTVDARNGLPSEQRPGIATELLRTGVVDGSLQIPAYAEHFGLTELLSEDFEDGRLYGTVTVRNPFT